MTATYSSGSTVTVLSVVESTFGVTPTTPTMKTLRVKPSKLNLKKDTYTTDEVRSDRGISDVRHGLRKAEGSLEGDLIVGPWDDFIEAALQGTWTAVTTGSATLSSSGSSSYTRATGSFVTDGFSVGDEITVSGFATAGNNGRTKVTSVAALTLGVAKVGTAESSVASCKIAVGISTTTPGKSLKLGTTMRSFTLEQEFADISQYRLFLGMSVNKMKLSVKPGSMVDISFDFMGRDADTNTSTAASVVSAAATNSPLSYSAGTLQEGGTTIAYVTGIDFDLDNGLAHVGVVGSDLTPAVFNGRSAGTGTLTALFKDQVMLNKFLDETESSIDILLNDPNGSDFHHIRLPRVKYTGADVAPPKDGAIIITLPFTVLYDSTTSTNVIWQRSNA